MLDKLRYLRWYYWGRWQLKRQINNKAAKKEKIKIVIGSGRTSFKEWISTDLPHFNILKKSDWNYFFSKLKIDNILAEHVLEHLTETENEVVLKAVFVHLKENGIFRIAVPDGYNPDPKYIDDVSPLGKIGASYGHKSLWNYKTYAELAKKNNFTIKFIEYFDEQKNYFLNPYNIIDGEIKRTGNNSDQNAGKSLVIDLIKS